jgi:Domain of unknown function (DUF6268)
VTGELFQNQPPQKAALRQNSLELVLTVFAFFETSRPDLASANLAGSFVRQMARYVVRISFLTIAALLGFSVSTAFGQSDAAGSLAAAGPLDATSLTLGSNELPAPRIAIPDIFRDARSPTDVVFRGQSSSTFETPAIVPPSYSAVSPYASAQDPFLYGPDPVLGGLGGGGTLLSGVNGPQPYRMGYTPRMDYTYLAPAGTSAPANGRFGTNEFNVELAHVTPVGPGWVFTSTPQAGVRLWDGPGMPNLPGSVYRMGWDLTLATPIVGLWSMQIDFNPSINTDFQSSLGRQAFNLDGNAMLFYRASPQWMLVLGAGYWDRVDKIILPYAGVVWNPNDRWEFRLLFPKSRISYFVGNIGNAAHWLYGSGEYHVESYQIQQTGVSDRQQIQIQDWRLAVGLRSEHVMYDKFVEVGYVFGRNVEFLNTTPGFNMNNTVMLRAGVRF